MKRKAILLSMLSFVCFVAASCNDNNGNNKTEPFKTDVEITMNKGADYIEHNDTYSNGNYNYNEEMWYLNKLEDLPLPDPHVYAGNDGYYITGTSDRSGAKEIDIYYTTDFVTYEEHYNVYEPASGSWEQSNPSFYAPELYCFDGVYYLYYSAMCKKEDNGLHDYRRYNSVVCSTTPYGPFEAIVNDEVDGNSAPLFAYDDCTTLDATIFEDTDKSLYMYYSATFNEGQVILGVKLESPFKADWSTWEELVKPGYIDSNFDDDEPLEWEKWRGYPITEGPYMIKSLINNKYYLTYSVNGCWNKYYTVCYAVSDSPLGNFVKPYEEGKMWTNHLFGYAGEKDSEGIVFNQWNGFASGTGHHCFFNIGDQIMIGYHAHKNRNWNSDSAYTQRYFAMDYLYFSVDGKPFCNGPTYSLQPLPELLSGYKNIANSATIRTENIINADALTDNYCVSNYNLDGEKVKEVKLGSGHSFIELKFDKEYSIGGLVLYNSAYYENIFESVKYIDFGNSRVLGGASINQFGNVNQEYEFVFPNSGITLEFPNNINTDKVIICFNTNNSNINEVKVLGK